MGNIIRDFGNMYGSTDTAYVVAYPYWVDTRLVGINAGDPTRDYAIAPDQIASTLNDPRPKLFLVYPEDQTSLDLLRQLFPQGNVSLYASKAGKDFYVDTVPPAISSSSAVPAPVSSLSRYITPQKFNSPPVMLIAVGD
jgi:hypothetical protein